MALLSPGITEHSFIKPQLKGNERYVSKSTVFYVTFQFCDHGEQGKKETFR